MPGKKEADYMVKIIFVGLSGEGKTSLLKAVTQGEVDLHEKPTLGIEFGSKKISLPDEKIVKLQMWTTSGQEKYQALDEPFYQGVQIACVVVDQALPLKKRKHLVTLYSEMIALRTQFPPTILVLEHDKTNVLQCTTTDIGYTDFNGNPLRHLVVSAVQIAADTKKNIVSLFEAALRSFVHERVYLDHIKPEISLVPPACPKPASSAVLKGQKVSFWRAITKRAEESILARALNWCDRDRLKNSQRLRVR